MSDIRDYGIEAEARCKVSDHYTSQAITRAIAAYKIKDTPPMTCPPFVHKSYEIGTTCPKGFITLNSFVPEDGDPFIECIGVVNDATVYSE